jgi:hypothetical protein
MHLVTVMAGKVAEAAAVVEDEEHEAAVFMELLKYLTNSGCALSSVTIKSLSWPLNLESKQKISYKMENAQ